MGTTTARLSENSRLGFDGIKAAVCLGSMTSNSNIASGLQPRLRRKSIRTRYTGQIRDFETGLDYFKARYYSSPLGRFTQPDPIWVTANRMRDPQQLNLYSYVRNNPLKFTDPTGLDLYLGECPSGDLKKCLEILKDGLDKDDKEHVKLSGNRVTVTIGHKSKSEAFQMLQSMANDPNETTRVSILSAGKEIEGFTFMDNKQIAISTPSYPLTLGEGWDGHALFQYRDGVSPKDGTAFFSNLGINEALIDGTASRVRMIQAAYEELKHVVLGDYGRTIPNSEHSLTKTPNDADNAINKVRQEVERNFLRK